MARHPTKLLRQPKPTTEKISPELLARIMSDPGGGLSNDILDYAFWRSEHEPDDGLVAALDKADRGDPEQIVQVLLNSDYDLPPLARYYLDNLIARGCIPANVKGELPPLSKISRSKLRAMLRPDRALSYNERRILADAIKRGIRRPKSAPPNIVYNKGLSEAMFLMAQERVRDLSSPRNRSRLYPRKPAGRTAPVVGSVRAKAIEKVADELGLNFRTLSEYLEKGRGATRRAKQHYENWLNGKSNIRKSNTRP